MEKLIGFSSFVAVLSFIGMAVGFLGTIFGNEQNKPVEQAPRWLFFVSFLVLVTSVTYLVTLACLQVFLGITHGFLYTAIPILVSGYCLSTVFVKTHESFLVNLKSNEFAMANDKLFGRFCVNESGIQNYRVFFGGLTAKFPWEIVEPNSDLNRDRRVEVDYNTEFKDGTTGHVRFSFLLKPNPMKLQQYVTTSTNTDERTKILEGVFGDTIKMILSDKFKKKTIDQATAKKAVIRDEVLKKGRTEIGTQEETYGVTFGSFVISDIDYPENIRDAYEQEIVFKRFMVPVKQLLKQRGYTDEQINGTCDENDRVPFEVLKWAFEQAQINTGLATLEIKDWRGLEGVMKALGNIGSK